MATPKTTPQRRPRHGGGLYTKTRTRRDPRTGRTFKVTYWEASWDIPEDRRRAGFARKRITGSGPTQSVALPPMWCGARCSSRACTSPPTSSL